jgi:uncharacterized protein YeaO (DUF488 family)
VPKSEFASRNYYDVWLPEVAPSEALVQAARAATTEKAWATFVKRYRRELARPEASRLIDLFVSLSRIADFSIGCYCEDERSCHRSVLRAVLGERGARVA